jgi:hypothetical protein
MKVTNTLAYYNKVVVKSVMKLVRTSMVRIEADQSNYGMAVNYHRKMFYNIGPYCPCYKTFYRGVVMPFQGNTVIPSYKAISVITVEWQ